MYDKKKMIKKMKNWRSLNFSLKKINFFEVKAENRNVEKRIERNS